MRVKGEGKGRLGGMSWLERVLFAEAGGGVEAVGL